MAGDLPFAVKVGSDAKPTTVDPIINFMDCTDDICKDRFSKGLDDRMDTSWLTHRCNL